MKKKAEVEFKDGYAAGWAMCIPECFKGSLKTKTFAAGDVFYDTPKAYKGTWAEALKYIQLSIQIQSFSPDGVVCVFSKPNKDQTKIIQTATRSIPVKEFIKSLKEGFLA